MLQKLLFEIQSGGTLEPGALAARLGTSPQMVRGMLEHLERMGMLQAFSVCSSQGCEGCGLTSSCLPASARGRVWKLTK
jgi:predicted ArsR family transcriptional regulator